MDLTGQEGVVENMPKASVIVPVYNVKDYLKKCVDSILAQTERDLEVLLIDDGSTDGSGALCDTLAERDARIRVIHQENQGLGGARDTGIQAAEGDWLLLVDSDDWIDPQVLEKTLEAGERERAELVIFGYRTVDEQGRALREFVETGPKNQGLSPDEYRHLFLIAPSAWNKLYRRELFTRTKLSYPSRVWYEDIRTTPKLMAAANRAVLLDYVGYNYLQRAGSIMNSGNVERNGEIIEAFDDLLTYFRERGMFEKYRDELCFLTLFHVYLTAAVRVIRLDRKHPLLGKFVRYMEENFPDYRQNKYLSDLTRNQKIVLALLEKKLYFPVYLIFKIKR